MKIDGPERMIICPYDTNHSAIAKNFVQHAIICARRHGQENVFKCPFNSSHVFLGDVEGFKVNILLVSLIMKAFNKQML